MANKGMWYVSFDLPRGQRAHARATETFMNEREASARSHIACDRQDQKVACFNISYVLAG